MLTSLPCIDYMKKVLARLTETGASKETIDEFKAGAPAAVKKILGNYDNYDVLMGQSMDGDAMYVYLVIYFLVATETNLMNQAHPD